MFEKDISPIYLQSVFSRSEIQAFCEILKEVESNEQVDKCNDELRFIYCRSASSEIYKKEEKRLFGVTGFVSHFPIYLSVLKKKLFLIYLTIC